jgi:hypothetical protein
MGSPMVKLDLHDLPFGSVPDGTPFDIFGGNRPLVRAAF